MIRRLLMAVSSNLADEMILYGDRFKPYHHTKLFKLTYLALRFFIIPFNRNRTFAN